MKTPKITQRELDVFDRLNKEGVCQLHFANEFETKFQLFDNSTFKRPQRFSLLVSKIEIYGKVFVERMEMDAFGLFHHWIWIADQFRFASIRIFNGVHVL